MPHSLILALVALATLIAVYWLMVRPFLAARPELHDVFAQLDNREAGLFTLAVAYFKGMRTILWSRFLVIAGGLLPVLDGIGTINLGELVREDWAKYVPLVLLLIGLITERLRRLTTGPVMATPASDPILPSLTAKAGIISDMAVDTLKLAPQQAPPGA